MECRILYALTGGGIQPVGVHASDIEYDNTTSQLTATNVQDALDEVAGRVSDAEGDITELNSSFANEIDLTGSNYNIHYIKIGNLCFVRGTITYTGISDTTITDLPSAKTNASFLARATGTGDKVGIQLNGRIISFYKPINTPASGTIYAFNFAYICN